MTSVFVSHPSDKLEHYFGPRAVSGLSAIAHARFNPEARELGLDELIAAARDSDVLIAYRQTAGPARLFEALPSLAAFVRCAVDISSVDVLAASAHGVLVTQASAGFVAAVAEWVIGAMLDLGRGIGRYAESYHAGVAPQPVMGRELRGSTLGVIGYGRIAKHLCELASAFGMQVRVAAPETLDEREGLRHVPLAALLAQSQFVVCLAPSNAQTRGLIDAAAFATMAPGSFFINAARGELLDEAALLAALESGRLGGAALDVGSAPDQMPSLELARHPRLIATPHIGGLTSPAIEHQALETVAQVAALQRGEMPPGAVNPADARRVRQWQRAEHSTDNPGRPT
jgi:D-3-phosphoglycerate dehydrogenase / 2-oxoglutarate reductase